MAQVVEKNPAPVFAFSAEKPVINGFASAADARRALAAAGIVFGAALTPPENNPKIEKNLGLALYTSALHFAPAKEGGYEICAQRSAGCTAACLHTAGNPGHMPAKQKARLARKKAFFEHRRAFMALLVFESIAAIRRAEKLGFVPVFRLNATSDFPFESVGIDINGEKFRNVFDAFPGVQYYDYTKIEKRALAWAAGNMPKNYFLTFSKSEINLEACKRVAAAGGNIAAVFSGGLPAEYLGLPVLDGDESDARHLDPRGVVLGLKAKGAAKTDDSGFVVHLAPAKARAA